MGVMMRPVAHQAAARSSRFHVSTSVPATGRPAAWSLPGGGEKLLEGSGRIIIIPPLATTRRISRRASMRANQWKACACHTTDSSPPVSDP
jgi:hypothetical protein